MVLINIGASPPSRVMHPIPVTPTDNATPVTRFVIDDIAVIGNAYTCTCGDTGLPFLADRSIDSLIGCIENVLKCVCIHAGLG